MITIGAVDDDGWGESVVRYQWSDTGDQLLVQLTESVRLFALEGRLTEKSVVPFGFDQVLGIGCAAGGWWLLTKRGSDVLFRHGLDGPDVVLDDLVAGDVSLPAVSPDGGTIACVFGESTVGLWSTGGGAGLFRFRVESQARDGEWAKEANIESMSWSPDGRHVALQLGFPSAELMILDVAKRRMLGEED